MQPGIGKITDIMTVMSYIKRRLIGTSNRFYKDKAG